MLIRFGFAVVAGVFGIGLASSASSASVMFDFGTADDGNSFEQTGWTLFEIGNNVAGPVTSPPDPVEGYEVTVEAPAGSNGRVSGRNRNPLVGTGGTFTLDDVYVDFIVSFDRMTISNLDPNMIYDLQIIMYDDNQSDSRTQTVTNVTDGASNVLGTIAVGPGTTLTSDTDFSVFGNGLAPDASGDIDLLFANSQTTNRSHAAGLIITEIPEPASLALVGLGGLMMLRRRR